MRRCWLLLLVVMPVFSFSQVKVSGLVINMADTRPVPSASVFLSNTTNGDETAVDGTFALQNVKPGRYDLVVSSLGFETYRQTILVEDTDMRLTPISLISTAILLKPVRIKPDNAWYRLYKEFKAEFLGSSTYAKECKILDPDSLDLSYDSKTRRLTAKSRGFLIIENKALGYRIKYLLDTFVKDNRDRTLVYKGFTVFENLKGSAAEQVNWKKNRLDCYRGSAMHFLRSIIKNKEADEGFEVYALKKTPVDDAAFSKDKDVFDPTKKYVLRFCDTLLTSYDYLNKTNMKGIFVLKYPDLLYVTYKNRMDYTNSYVYKQFHMPNWATTIITIVQPYAPFDNNGVLADPLSVYYEGYWADTRVAEQLPVDYDASVK